MNNKNNSQKLKADKPFNPQKPWLPNPSAFVGTWRDDWRIAGQEGYLMNSALQYITYSRDLCVDDFCSVSFASINLTRIQNIPQKLTLTPNRNAGFVRSVFETLKSIFIGQ